MPDVRLIDANAVLKKIEETYCTDCNNYNGVCCRACEHMDDMDFIEDAPTIDAQPVKHGKWEYQENMPFESCSICRYRNYDPVYTPNFCPNCGAYMWGDAK